MRQKLQSALDIELLEVVNESASHRLGKGGDTHFRLLVVSKNFEGLSTVRRHQMVYKILHNEVKNVIHALSQQTFTPKEWESVLEVDKASPPCHNRGDS